MTSYACLTCGAISPTKRCARHAVADPTSWNGGRSRKQQHTFRLALLARAGHQCEHHANGERCQATTELQAHHCDPGNHDPSEGLLLCRPHHRAIDSQAR